MNSQLLKALGAEALGPLMTLSLATAAQAQTAEPMPFWSACHWAECSRVTVAQLT